MAYHWFYPTGKAQPCTGCGWQIDITKACSLVGLVKPQLSRRTVVFPLLPPILTHSSLGVLQKPRLKDAVPTYYSGPLIIYYSKWLIFSSTIE